MCLPLAILALYGAVASASILSQNLTPYSFTVNGQWQNFTQVPVPFNHQAVNLNDHFDIIVGGTTNTDSLNTRMLQLLLGGMILAQTGPMNDLSGLQLNQHYEFRFSFECTAITATTVSYQAISAQYTYGDTDNQVTKSWVLEADSVAVPINNGYIMMQINTAYDSTNPLTITNNRFVVIAGGTSYTKTLVPMSFSVTQCSAATPTVNLAITKIGNVVTIQLPAGQCSVPLSISLTNYVFTSSAAIPTSYRPNNDVVASVVYAVGTTQSAGGVMTISASTGIITYTLSLTLGVATSVGTTTANSISYLIV